MPFAFSLRPALRRVLAFAAVLVLAPAVSAQDSNVELADVPALRAAMEAAVQMQPVTEAVPGGRRDARTGAVRARYFGGTQGASARRAVSAEAVLRREAASLGIEPSLRDLRVVATTRLPQASHTAFEQQVGGVPVFGAGVYVSRDAQGRPTMLFSTYDTGLEERASTLRTTPSLRAGEAGARAAEVLRDAYGAARVEPGEKLVVMPGTAPDRVPRLAWEMNFTTPGIAASWQALVCAHTGELLLLRDRLRTRKAARGGAPAAPAALAALAEATRAPAALLPLATPTGTIFDTDPLTSSGADYGGDYSDGFNDRDTPALNAERKTVELLGVTQSASGRYRLAGPYVRITEDDPFDIALPYTPPDQASPSFDFPRSDQHFEAVNTYVHIDRAQRYVQSLEVGRDMVNRPISVNPHGYGNEDNSAYDPQRRMLVFGDGGVDDGEDASIIWHEYGHALLDDVAPDLVFSDEMDALHEGWSDYFAASYQRALYDGGFSKRADWVHLFRWDIGGGAFWDGRRLDATGRYPEDTGCDTDGQGGFCDIYEDGRLWATTLMGLQDKIGRTASDRIVISSLGYLNGAATFRDAAEALVQADADLYGGTYREALIEHLVVAGYLPGGYVSVDGPEVLGAQDAELLPAAPNPFASTTEVRFRLGAPARVSLAVYDLMGRRVADLASEVPYGAGVYSLPFDASALPAGVYFARMEARGEASRSVQTRRLVRLR